MDEIHKPTLRVIRILEYVSESPKGITLSEISKKSGLPKSTLVPILKTLREYRYLQLQEKTGLYMTGYKLFSIGSRFLEKFDIMDEIGKELQFLASYFEETCYFGILEQGNVLYLLKKENLDSLGVLTTIGKTKPAYGTGLGKALLMDMNKEDLRALYPEGLKPLTDNTICDYERLSEELNLQRTLGYTWENEESTRYIQCFAVPLRKGQKIIGAISVAIPVFRYKEDRKGEIIEKLMNAKSRIEQVIEETDARFDIEIG